MQGSNCYCAVDGGPALDEVSILGDASRVEVMSYIFLLF